MKKRIKTLIVTFMLITPVLSIPKLPTIPTISADSIKLPAGVEEAAKNAGAEAASKIDWSKIKIDWSKYLK